MILLLFDVDGTICESGKKINNDISIVLKKLLDCNIDIGIVGGGTFEKISYQLNNTFNPKYIFSECGSCYYLLENNKYNLIYKNDLRLEPEYIKINELLKLALFFISTVDYLIAGNIIDIRNGLIYISLVGMTATETERNNFIKIENRRKYRNALLSLLQNKAKELHIDEYLDITFGGSVGIAIYPKKWNKIQVIQHLPFYTEIHYFGDKYMESGNDYEIMNHNSVIPHKIDTLEQTLNILEQLYDAVKKK